MFTGLIEAVCTVRAVNPADSSGGGAVVVDLGALADGVKRADSIAVDGACVTVTKLEGATATFGLSRETLERSTLVALRPGSDVNIERAMQAGARFGGHMVQGHVDGIGTVKAVNTSGEYANIEFAAEKDLLDLMVAKGSVAVNGISLTIAAMAADNFTVAAIPETLTRTTLGKARIGDRVNIETDIIVKAVKKQLDNMLGRQKPLTVERLKELGF